jgi:hypothetical protein
MIGSSIVLSCFHCHEKLGSMLVDMMSSLTAEEVISLLQSHRINLLCRNCSCMHEVHEFADNDNDTVKLLDAGQRNTIEAERDSGQHNRQNVNREWLDI